MYVQIGVWGSKRLAKHIMERSHPGNPDGWLAGKFGRNKPNVVGFVYCLITSLCSLVVSAP